MKVRKYSNRFLALSLGILCLTYLSHAAFLKYRLNCWYDRYIDKNQTGLQTFYYPNWNLSGSFAKTEATKELTSPYPTDKRFKRNNFSLRAIGVFSPLRAGHYKFFLKSDDGSSLYINNRLVIDNGGIHPAELKADTVFFRRGLHLIVVEYFQNLGNAVLEFNWLETGETDKSTDLSTLFYPVNNKFKWDRDINQHLKLSKIPNNIYLCILAVISLLWFILRFGRRYYLSCKGVFKRHELFSISILCCFILIINFYPIIFEGKTLVSNPGSRHVTDGGGPYWEIEPFIYLNHYFYFVIKTIPLWNPYNDTGFPLAAMVNCGSFSPVTFLSSILPSYSGIDFFMLFRLFIAGIFMYLFLRRIGINILASSMGSFLFMLAPPHIACINQFQMDTVVFIPAILYFLEKSFTESNKKNWIWVSISIALAILGGNPEECFLVMILITFYFLTRIIYVDYFQKIKYLKYYFVFAIIGVCLASFFLFPVIEFYINSEIPTGRSFSRGTNLTLPVLSKSIFFMKIPHMPPTTFYLGIIPIYLAFLIFLNIKNINKPKRGYVIFSFLYMILFLFMLFNNPILYWIKSLPIISHIWWGKYSSTFYVALTVSASFGLNILMENKKLYKWGGVFLSFIIFLFFLYIVNYSERKPEFRDNPVVLYYLFIALACFLLSFKMKYNFNFILVCFLFLIDLYLFIPRMRYPDRPDGLPKSKAIAYLKGLSRNGFFRVWLVGGGSILEPNRNCIYQLPIIGYSGLLRPKRRSGFYDYFFANPEIETVDKFYRGLDLLGIKYLYSNKGVRIFGDVDKMLFGKFTLKTERDIQNHFYSIGGKIKHGALLGNDEELIFNTTITDNNILKFSIAPNPFYSTARDEGFVDFFIDIIADNNKRVPLFKRDIHMGTNKWNNFEINLSDFKNKKITLFFGVEGEKAGIWADFMLTDRADSNLGVEDSRWKMVYCKDVNGDVIYENRNALDRAYIVHSAVIRQGQEILEMLNSPDFDFKHKIVIEKDIPKEMINCNGAPIEDNSIARFLEYTPNRISIEADMRNDGFLVLSDTFYPGWKVYVDGKEKEILAANHLVRAVYLRKGNHVVKFIYNPLTFRLGSVISILALIVLVIYSLI